MLNSKLNVKKSGDRGHANHGWLKSQHSFSFANYYDPANMGFRALRVINEDYIDGGMGFGMHPHRDMEIITYVVKGALQHKDSMGTSAVIKPGEVQYMSAGTGVMHSEFNPNKEDETHLLQIWIQPSASGGEPRYGQKSFAGDLEQKKLVLTVSPDGREGSIAIKQDAYLYASRPKAGDKIDYELREGRGAWVQLIAGEITVNGEKLVAGDALSLEDAGKMQITATRPSEFLLFDLAEF